ncbi:transcription factor S [Candidatus Woesearchaeota archaeon]|nr:transcription factor S [Candidatus Woesearchaeota archaeon]
MQFCPKCGSIMMPKKDESGKVTIACSCGYTAESGSSGAPTSFKDETKKEDKEEVKFDVADEDVETLPQTKEECPKCGNETAYYWLIQTRAGDESETRFLKCTKCKHTWREYD